MKLSRKPVLHGGRLRWRVYWTVQRKAHRRFFRTKDEAEKFLEDLRRERAAFGAVWLALAPLERVALVEIWQRARAGGYTLSEACDLFEKQGKPGAQGGPERLTVPELVHRVMDAKLAKNLRERSLDALARTLNGFAEAMGELPLDRVRPEMIEAFVNRPEWAPRTRLGHLVNLSTMFNFAVKRGWLLKAPTAAVEPPKIDDAPVVILEAAEAERLLRMAERMDPELVGFWALALFAGLRPESEIGRLSRTEIERALEVGELEVSRGKVRVRSRRLIAVRPNLAAWLAKWLPLGCDLVPVNFKRRWIALRDAAGWAPPREWPQDAARHTFCSAVAVLSGELVAAREAGHSPEMGLRHYRRPLTGTEAAAWFEIWPSSSVDYHAAAKARAEAAAAKRRLSPEQMAAMARKRWAQ